MKNALVGVLLVLAGLSECLPVSAGVRRSSVNPAAFVKPSVLQAREKPLEGEYVIPERLRFPYLATHYVEPTLTTEMPVKIGYYVTDFEQSEVRFKDASRRFGVRLAYRLLPDGKERELVQKKVKPGDSLFNLGRLAPGTYRLCISATDLSNGLESHRTWHEFRVVKPGDLVIPPDKVYRMTAADLAVYGIRADGDLGREVQVELDEAPDYKNPKELKARCDAAIDAFLASCKLPKRTRTPGYDVLIPSWKGEPISWPQRYARVVYDANYDSSAVERAAVATSEGLQRFIDDKVKAGFRKLVLLKGCYRTSPHCTVRVPTRFTLDLGGATIKMNGFSGDDAQIVWMPSVSDSHLVNGTLEGDYYEHVYTNSAEFVHGFRLSGDTRYSSVERVTVKNITGYGGINDIKSDETGGPVCFDQFVERYEPGGLDPKTGAFDAKDLHRFTSAWLALSPKMLETGWLQVSRFLGYQAPGMRSLYMTACWYDADRKLLATETLRQYRPVPIPSGAKFLRYSVEAESLEATKRERFALTHFRHVWNCAVRDCTFTRVRAVGYAPQQMRNCLFEGNLFERSGEALAQSAIDAEDGWDQMQDCLFRRNRFVPYIRQKGILCHGGHNMMLEGNEGALSLTGRCYAPQVRGNKVTTADFSCDNWMRSGYGRFLDNSYETGVSINRNRMTGLWDYTFDLSAADTNRPFSVSFGPHGHMIGETVRGRTFNAGKATGCVFVDCKSGHGSGNWLGCVASKIVIDGMHSFTFDMCDFAKCRFYGFGKERVLFRNCTLEDCRLDNFHGANIVFENCRLVRCGGHPGFYQASSELRLRDCELVLGKGCFYTFPLNAVGDVSLERCGVTAADSAGASVFAVEPYGGSDTNRLGKITAVGCTFGEGVRHFVAGQVPETSPKDLVVRGKGNRFAEGGRFCDPKLPNARCTVKDLDAKRGR